MSTRDRNGGATLDSGALIAFERERRDVVALVRRTLDRGDTLSVPVGALAQVWRDGARQARLAWLLGSPLADVVELSDHAARAVGQLLGVSGTSDVVDASVVWCAQQRSQVVITSDPDDLLAIDPTLRVYAC